MGCYTVSEEPAVRKQSDKRARISRTEPLPPDPVIEVYKKDVDRTLLHENLKLTPEQRILNLQSFVDFIFEFRQAVKNTRR
jgi:hypothetical protein